MTTVFTLKNLKKILKKGHVRLKGNTFLLTSTKSSSRVAHAVQKHAEFYILFYQGIKALKIEKPVQEYRFHKTRRWRFDFCFVDSMLALEVEGGIWTDGRHTRGSGFIKDMEKYNQAAILGYSLLRTTPEQMQNGEAVLLIEQWFKEKDE